MHVADSARAAAHTGLHDHAVCLINRRERLLAQRKRAPAQTFSITDRNANVFFSS